MIDRLMAVLRKSKDEPDKRSDERIAAARSIEPCGDEPEFDPMRIAWRKRDG